jgi:hypothetical protein
MYKYSPKCVKFTKILIAEGQSNILVHPRPAWLNIIVCSYDHYSILAYANHSLVFTLFYTLFYKI